jgi:hypothetical protein
LRPGRDIGLEEAVDLSYDRLRNGEQYNVQNYAAEMAEIAGHPVRTTVKLYCFQEIKSRYFLARKEILVMSVLLVLTTT